MKLNTRTDYYPRLDDRRLEALRDTWFSYEPPVFPSLQTLEARRAELRHTLLMSAGLYPLPERTPLNTKRELVGEYDGYTIYKIMFESFPGLWSTGNLYMPQNLTSPAPAIMNVIGHWDDQRLTRRTDDEATAADYPQQLANFAKMGFVCLVTDMIGKVDSRQLSHEYGWKKDQQLILSNGLGIQLWNNIRALDLLCAMPEVDGTRIGVTGASGGGSQSLFLALADDRITAVAPINMISLHFQGGCFCENAPGLRRDTTNAELCAVLAPRPLFLSGSTGDWTCNLLTCEMPIMRRAYRLYGAEDKLDYIYQHRDHQYNSVTRKGVYAFFAKHLMGKELEWEEQPVEIPDILDLTWFRNEDKPLGFADDVSFYRFHWQERRNQTAKLSREERIEMLRWMTGVRKDRLPQMLRLSETYEESYTLFKGLLADSFGAQTPFAVLFPRNWDRKNLTILLSDQGKECLRNAAPLLEQGMAVLSADLYGTGEYTEEPEPRNHAVNYFSCFHDTDAACQVQDLCLLKQLADSFVEDGGKIFLEARDETAWIAACALPLLDGLSGAVLDKAVDSISADGECMLVRHCFIPGLGVLKGIPGCLALTDTKVSFL